MSAEVKEGKRPQYKDYVSFLESYKNGKKDEMDSGNFSLTNSSNNSSSSVNSDVNNERKKGFKEYLENYNNKKYSPVQPSFIKQNKAVEGNDKTVVEKSNVSNVSKVFEKTTTTTTEYNRVNSVSKMFEKNSAATDSSSSTTKTVSSKVNQFEFQILNRTDIETQEEQRKISITEISKKFESKQKTNDKKIPLKKSNSITEKSKVFEENATTINNNRKEIEVKKNIFNGASKKDNSVLPPPIPQSQPPKISLTKRPPSPAKSATSPSPIKPENLPTKPDLVVPNFPPPPPPPQPSKIVTKRSPSPSRPTSPQTTPTTKFENPPKIDLTFSAPPPPPPPQFDTPARSASPTKSIPSPPPPPPPLPNNFKDIKMNTMKPNGVKKVQTNGGNGYSTLPRVQNGDKVDGGIPTPSLDKNDPRVKKLVYGALRDMYGAYHDKANDYLATLPKNRVRKNNGLDSIINSIAAQGGLDKLTGRVNPNVEVE